MDEIYFTCAGCRRYYAGKELFFDYKGYRLRGCPKCQNYDSIKQVSESDFIIAKGVLKIRN